MYCSKCGKEIKNSANFCHYCGTAIYEDNIKKNDTRKTYISSNVNTKFIIYRYAIGLFILLILVGNFLPVIKIESRIQTNYFNAYQYLIELSKEIKYYGSTYSIITAFEAEGWCSDVLSTIVLGVMLLAKSIGIFYGIKMIWNILFGDKKFTKKNLKIFAIVEEIFGICVLYFLWGGMAYGEQVITHYDYFWGEHVNVTISLTIGILYLILIPLITLSFSLKILLPEQEKIGRD